jgi:hypothetical protein
MLGGYVKRITDILHTFGIFLNHCVLKLNHIVGLVIGDVFTKDHIFVEIACIENTGRKSDCLDIGIDMVFSLKKKGSVNSHQSPKLNVPSYILETKRPPEICAELGSELQIKHCTPAA